MASRFAVLLSAVCLILPTESVRAQASGGVEISGFIGGAVFTTSLAGEDFLLEGTILRFDDPELKGGLALGAHVGYAFGQVAVEGTVMHIPTALSGGDILGVRATVDTNVLIYGVNVLYTLPSQNQLMDVFLTAGLGVKAYSFEAGDSQTNFGGNIGAGLKVWITPAMALRFDGRDYISPFKNGNLQNDLVLSMGLTFAPGRG